MRYIFIDLISVFNFNLKDRWGESYNTPHRDMQILISQCAQKHQMKVIPRSFIFEPASKKIEKTPKK